MKSIKKIQFLAALLFLFVSSAVIARSDIDFNEPWKNPDAPIIIDAFYKNSIDWVEMKKDTRVAAILHKATEGLEITDPAYAERREKAKQLGYKWGSYHLLRRGDPGKQAEFYLAAIGNTPGEVMAVDVECTEYSKCGVEKYRVTANEIKTFILAIKRKTGRYPIFYGNQSVVADLSRSNRGDDLLVKIPLWYARFKSQVTDFPEGIWDTYTFWQFSSEINCAPEESCLYRVPGTLSDMDINVFNGTLKTLRAKWGKIGQ
ncbi:MAG: glycoside hydrolase family 25 protein [Acidobacteria bacterium]|nr:glycoside hydrolase family 25 protein [Acidobacteriota bacterium]